MPHEIASSAGRDTSIRSAKPRDGSTEEGRVDLEAKQQSRGLLIRIYESCAMGVGAETV